MSTRRTGTPTVLSAASGVQTRELRRTQSGTATPTGLGTAQLAPQVLEAAAAELSGQAGAPWWASVTRWEKRKVIPHGANPTNGMVATLGARPGTIPKPSQYPVQIVKWVRSEKPPATFDDDEDEVMEEAAAPEGSESFPIPDIATVDVPDESQPVPDETPAEAVEVEGEETIATDAEGTKRIVEEELLLDYNSNITAMDVEQALAHPEQPIIGHPHTVLAPPASPKEHQGRSPSPSPPSHAERREAATESDVQFSERSVKEISPEVAQSVSLKRGSDDEAPAVASPASPKRLRPADDADAAPMMVNPSNQSDVGEVGGEVTSKADIVPGEQATPVAEEPALKGGLDAPVAPLQIVVESTNDRDEVLPVGAQADNKADSGDQHQVGEDQISEVVEQNASPDRHGDGESIGVGPAPSEPAPSDAGGAMRKGDEAGDQSLVTSVSSETQ
ncbi:hypothetical protein HK097_005573 [Rhizophlyctis rosea]|uniref:Uncharacterized protein n=1 Tax=Rhizophlyctis rosea TaxID=64517 RepID=A0AAD5SFF1_9FUNG|nr:hypothetical protein HK097_005573 [Rhizophlyctis rosea]